jgi:PilZ domain
LNSNSNSSPGQGHITKLIHLALPVRWSLIGGNRGTVEMACTYDIHPNGARLLSARDVNVGDLVLVERGRNKATCKVIWAADPESPLRGQFTVECVEGRAPWDDELRQLQSEEQYQPVVLDETLRSSSRSFRQPESNRRRRPRFYAEGQVEVIDGAQRTEGEVEQISECGARINSLEPLRPGTDFRLMLNMFDVSVALKAQVKYLVNNLGMGVEFNQIRRGDRPLLSYVLSKLKSRRVEEFARVEVVSESLATAV